MRIPWKRAERSALKVALLYLAFGCLWILGTDSLVHYLVDDPARLENWQNSKGLLFVVLSFLLIFFTNRSETRRRLRAEIDLIHMETRTKEFVLNTNEEERNRISSELHDGVQQEMAGVSMMLQTLKEEKPEQLPERIEEVRKALDNCIKEVRKVSHYNSSFRIDEKGGAEAIDDLFNQIRREKGIETETSLESIRDREINYFTAVNLYRISQELLQNVKKHSNADHVSLHIEKNGENSFLYRFQENGTIKNKGKEGFGKRSIRRRVQCLGGHFLGMDIDKGNSVCFLFLDLDRDSIHDRLIQERFDGNFLPLEKQSLNLVS